MKMQNIDTLYPIGARSNNEITNILFK